MTEHTIHKKKMMTEHTKWSNVVLPETPAVGDAENSTGCCN